MSNTLAKKAFAVASSSALVLASFASFATATVHTVGTNVSVNGTVYFIDPSGVRRGYTSGGAFLSYGFNSWSQVVPASAEDLALPVGSFVPPMDGSLINDMGTIYVINNGQRSGITSMAVFNGLGYKLSNVMVGDTSFMPSATILSNSSQQHPTGALVNQSGTIYLITSSGKMGIPSESVFNTWGYSFAKAVPANAADIAVPMSSGIMQARVMGQLNPTGAAGGVTIPPVTGSSLSVSASSDMPAGSTLVAGQATADLGHFTFYGNGAVTQVSLKRIGVSSDSALNNVYLYQGNTRLTDAASVTTGSNISFSNPNGLFTVNGSANVSVRADIASVSQVSGISGQTVGVQLVSAMSGTLAVTGVPVSGNISTVSGASTAAVTVGTNTIGNSSINAGSTTQTVWSAPITVGTRVVWLKSLALREVGSAPTNALGNYGLYLDGNKVASASGLVSINGSSYVSFDLGSTPATMNTGSHTLDVRADFITGATRTVQFTLQNAADLMVTDSQFNVNITPTNVGGAQFTANSGGTITIGNGSLTISSDPSFGVVTTVTGGATNTPIARYKVQAYGEDMQVNSLTLAPSITGGLVTPVTAPTGTVAVTNGSATVTGTGTNFSSYVALDKIVIGGVTYTISSIASNTSLTLSATYAGTTASGLAYTISHPDTTLNNVTLFVNGAQVGSSQNFNGSTALVYNLGSSMIIPAGQSSTLEVRADLITANNLNYTAGTVTASITGTTNTAQGRYSGTLYNVPAATAASSLTVGTAALTIAASNGFVSQNVSPNNQNVKLGSFVLQSSNSEPIRLTSMTVGISGSAALTNLTNLKVFVNGTQVGNTVGSPTASNSFSPNVTIPVSSSGTVDIFGDLGSATTGTEITTLTVTSIGQNSNQTSTSLPITGQTMTVAVATVTNPPTIVASASTQAQYIAAGTASGVTDASVASFNFLATSGTANINELRFTVTGSGVTNVKVGGVTAPVVGGVATITGLNIAVPNGSGGVNVPVTVSYSPVGVTGVASATTNSVALTYVKYVAGGTTTVITPNVAAPTQTLVGSKPTLSVDTAQKSGLILGAENKIGEVTVTADAAGNISVGTIRFNVGGSGVSVGPAVTSARIASGTTTISGTTCTATTASGVTTRVDCVFSPEFLITASTSQVFSLYGVVNATVVAGATVSVSTSVDQTNFLWTDVAGGGTLSARSGALVYNFPTGSFSIKQ
ncbi:MAG: baaA1 [Candidatus Doudnabacteria bacterium]|nr:baaA1 [Candidatus Doudnabacteria bacterium]